jgi:hypothetical protein
MYYSLSGATTVSQYAKDAGITDDIVRAWEDKKAAFVSKARTDIEQFAANAEQLIAKKSKYANELLSMDANSPAGKAVISTLKAVSDGKIRASEVEAIAGGAAASAGVICGPGAPACAAVFATVASFTAGSIHRWVTGEYKKARREEKKAESFCKETKVAWQSAIDGLSSAYYRLLSPYIGNKAFLSRADAERHMINAGAVPPPDFCSVPCSTWGNSNCVKPETARAKASDLIRKSSVTVESTKIAYESVIKSYADLSLAYQIKSRVEEGARLAKQLSIAKSEDDAKRSAYETKMRAAQAAAAKQRARNYAIAVVSASALAAAAVFVLEPKR